MAIKNIIGDETEFQGASINSESQFFHFADSTQNNAESLSTDPMLRLFCRGSC